MDREREEEREERGEKSRGGRRERGACNTYGHIIIFLSKCITCTCNFEFISVHIGE